MEKPLVALNELLEERSDPLQLELDEDWEWRVDD
jgi:hypothetical protein